MIVFIIFKNLALKVWKKVILLSDLLLIGKYNVNLIKFFNCKLHCIKSSENY